MPVDGELEKGSRVFMTYCSPCHTMDSISIEGSRGPALGLIFNRRAGSDVKYEGYSEVMTKTKLYWTARNLYHFMYNPQSVVSGTICSIMRGVGLKSEEDRADLLTFLQEYSI